MKTLNIELNVRRMDAQSILTTSASFGHETENQLAPERQGGVVAPAAGGAGVAGGNAGAVPVRAGF